MLFVYRGLMCSLMCNSELDLRIVPPNIDASTQIMEIRLNTILSVEHKQGNVNCVYIVCFN